MSDAPISHKRRWPQITVPIVIVRPETKVAFYNVLEISRMDLHGSDVGILRIVIFPRVGTKLHTGLSVGTEEILNIGMDLGRGERT